MDKYRTQPMERWNRIIGIAFTVELLLILVAGGTGAFWLNESPLRAITVVGTIAWLLLAWVMWGKWARPSQPLYPWQGTLQFVACWLIFPLFKAIRLVFIAHTADASLLALDRALWGGTSLPERLLGWERPWLSEVLSAAYFMFYCLVLIPAIAFSVRRRSREARAFFMGLSAMYLVGFAGYVLVPAGGPYMAFPAIFPYPVAGGPITAFLVNVVNNGITGMDTFPSLHAGISVYVLGFFALGGYRKTALIVAPVVVALIVATIYLRYHYGIDLLCGLGVSAVVLVLVQRYRREYS